MILDRLQKRFDTSLNQAEKDLSNFLSNLRSTDLQKSEIHQLEGCLSEIWQLWCRFCRTTVFASCTGCSTISSGPIHGTYTARTLVSYIAAKQSRGVPPNKLGHNSILRNEPTWGHINKLIEVIQALAPSNSFKLLSGFGTVPQIDDIRIIRNAAAHRNLQTLEEVYSLISSYKTKKIHHPIEALLWSDPNTGRTLIQSRINDMRIASRNICI